MVDDNNLAAPEWCRGCPDPIYDDRRGRGAGGAEMRGLWFTAGFLLGVVTTALGLL